MAKRSLDTVPLDELVVEELPKEKKEDVPSWLWDYMVKKCGQDGDLVRKIWLLLKDNYADPKKTVKRLGPGLFSTMTGIYATAGGEAGPKANQLVEAYQLAR